MLTIACIVACLALLWAVQRMPRWAQYAFWLIWLAGWLYFIYWGIFIL